MSGLLDLTFDRNATVRYSAGGLLRHVRHAGFNAVVEDAHDVGIVIELSSSHRVEGTMGGRWTSSSPNAGSITIIPPHRRLDFEVTGVCSALNMRLPWLLIERAAQEFDVAISGASLISMTHSEDAGLSNLIYTLASAGPEETNVALYEVARYVVRLSIQKDKNLYRRRGGLTPHRLTKALKLMHSGLDQDFILAEIATSVGLSQFHFARLFRAETGQPPRQYIIRRRVARAIELLNMPDLTIDDIANQCGFAQRSHLAKAFGRVTGLSPSGFRRYVVP